VILTQLYTGVVDTQLGTINHRLVTDVNKSKMAETLSYQAMRTANVAREADEQRKDALKKNLLLLVLHYLNEEGYVESAQCLSRETNLDLNKFEVCDNVSLETVLMEYIAYYRVKFSKDPKITKKLANPSTANDSAGKFNKSAIAKRRSASSQSLPKLVSPQEKSQTSPSLNQTTKSAGVARKPPAAASARKKEGEASSTSVVTNHASDAASDSLSLKGVVVPNLTSASSSDSNPHQNKQPPKAGRQIIDIRAMLNDVTRLSHIDDTGDDRLLKPLGGYSGYNTEWRELAQVISRDIYLENPNVRWNDIIGLDTAKRLVKEAVVYPIRYPQLFTGILSPWKGLLLYGPPGTGKTLLAKAVATECKTTFFNISASSIVSKWRGDSEKLVRVLFELARYHAPSTIFLDELESLMSQRGGQSAGGEHEGSRRMKTELLVQMDGLAKSDEMVFLLAASNLPWELDHAMLRRLEKRILVGLPTSEARHVMFQHHLPQVICTPDSNGFYLTSDLNYESLAQATEGYSGSDIRLVCKEAAMRPIRKIFDTLEKNTEGQELHFSLDSVSTHDVTEALASTKPSARTLVEKYVVWQREYESV